MTDATTMDSSLKEQGATLLEWKNLRYSIPNKKVPDGRKVILHPQSGHAAPGDLLAIMGPSGSGKTSLLNALAGRLPVTKGAHCNGSVEVNRVPKQELPCPFADISAYVEQDDALFALSTVQETLHFCAQLRLPSTMPMEERADRIDNALRQLGLIKSRHTNVGGNSFNGALRGLSGGERKRLSIAIELLHKPKCIFLDEPTTGLDSYQALNVVGKMNELAKENHTIVVSIHQPRSAIFAMFTGIYLLAEGKPCFAGSTDAAADHFARVGFPLPPKFSPADFFIDLVSTDQRDEEQQKLTEARLANLQECWSKTSSWERQATGDSIESIGKRRNSILEARSDKPAGQHALVKPFFLLLTRCWREQMRDKFAILMKTFFAAFMSGIFGLVFWQLDQNQKAIQNRTGLLFFLTMNQAFGSVIGTSQVIPRQIAVVQRERANRMYAILPYYISNLMVTIPIEVVPVLANAIVVYYMADLGGSFFVFSLIIFLENLCGVSLGMALSASFKSVTMAPQIAPAVVIIFLIFNGFMINEESIPVYFIWLRELSFVRYAFQAVAVNEFAGATFTCDDVSKGASCITSGDTVLAQFGFTDDFAIMRCMVIMGVICVGFNLLAFLILLVRRPKFLPLESSSVEDDATMIKVAPSLEVAETTASSDSDLKAKQVKEPVDLSQECNV